ncbi:MAG: DUF721 domain-containing protein [Zoogloea sp.]|nr:DUF721 domain-containing protein [Zoogloea sp.]
MAATSLNKFFGNADALARLQTHARRLVEIQVAVERNLPDWLAQSCRVANLRPEGLVLHADSGGVAVKVKQALPSLIAGLAREGFVVESIKVKVLPLSGARRESPPPDRSVGKDAKQAMQALADSLPADSPLSSALRRFVRTTR